MKNRHYQGEGFQLQFSIHSTDAQVRRDLIPVRGLPFEWMASYGERFRQKGERKISLNFAVGDSAQGQNAPGIRSPGGRVSKEVVEASKRNPLVSKTLELFNGIVLNVSRNPGAQQT